MVAVLSLLLLVYDYVINLSKEIRFFWRPERTFFSSLYLASRYAALVWTIFVCAVWASVATDDRTACNIARYWPQGYTLVEGLATGVMSMRVWVIYHKSTRVACALGVLVICSLAVEIGCNLFVQGER